MPLSKIEKPRKSPVLLRRRMPSTSVVSDAFVETESADRQVFIRPLPDWMQPPHPDAIRSRPAQSPPEIVPAVVPVSAVDNSLITNVATTDPLANVAPTYPLAETR